MKMKKNKKETIDISQNELMAIIRSDGVITPEQFMDFLIEYLLGKPYYIGFSCGGAQGRLIILTDILRKYSKRFNDEIRELTSLEEEAATARIKIKEISVQLPGCKNG